MKKYIASVKYNGRLQIMKVDDYKSKADFAKDLRGNGYKVRFISTPEKFNEDCEKYYRNIEKQTYIRKAIREYEKGRAER